MTSRAGPRSVGLIGFMAVGKSAVGRKLAHALKFSFLDLDGQIEAATGLEIARIIADRGVKEFRRIEAEALRRALSDGPTVLSLGGGALLRRENRVSLNKSAVSVWLDAPLSAIRSRVSGGPDRPLWPATPQGQRELLERRKPSYFLADLRVPDPGGGIDDWAQAVEEALGRFGFFR